ncbi:hypothetical protein AYO38_01250 [bacterium SCGC AG-212-C10]|nr:hypothetical protein AYO38_01250 [bacterium SCGC AG-212-C10]
MNYYTDVLKKYTLFDGRAGRREFWMFALISFGIGVVLAIIDAILGTQSGGIGLIGSLYSLAVLLPSLAVGSRRLHDTGRSGWLQLLGLIPVVGIIILIVFWAQDSAPGSNSYGPHPSAP